MRLRSLFSGIEGFGLGFQIALGSQVEIIDQAENDPFAIRILEARYPNVTRIPDVRLIDAGAPPCDVMAAGFPCQPVSQAGPNNTKGASYADDARWLWPEVRRIMEATRPPLVLVENVRGLLRAGMREVVTGLASIGYAAQWDLIPAAAVGAPHLRHRVWLVAYPEDAPIGRIFDRTPPVFAWPDESTALPRLTRGIPNRRGRLAALGNAVVPACVAYLAHAIVRAKAAEPLIPAGLFGVDPAAGWSGSYPAAGALLGGMLYEEATVTPRIDGRLWPTPAAQENGWPLDTLLTCIAQDGSSPPSDWNQRFYNRETGQLVQKGLVQVAEAVERGIWPTPTRSSNRRGRSVLLADQWSRPGLEQMAEIVEGTLPREFESPEELRGEAAKLWPTPTASDKTEGWAGRSDKRTGAPPLRDAVVHDEEGIVWPTPTASLGDKGPGPRDRRPAGHDDLITRVVREDEERLWPTPNAVDGSGGGSAKRVDDPRRQTKLSDAAVKEASGDEPGRSLNPRWVEWLMGYPLGWTEVE